MNTKELNKALDGLTFNDPNEKGHFHSEMESLLASTTTAHLVRGNTIPLLKDLFVILSSNQSAFSASLLASLRQANHSQLLLDYFVRFDELDLVFPNKGTEIEVFVHLCSKGLENDELETILSLKILENYQAQHLQLLPYFYSENIAVFIEFFRLFNSDYPIREKILILELLHLLYPTTLRDDAAQDFHYYFQHILPHFIQRFSHRMTAEQLYTHTDKIAEWYMTWSRHYHKEENESKVNDEYYEMDFPTIVKYIPEFIWWNNGLYYNNGDKNFYFGSPGFFHLAQGGSIRNAPDKHHFTRRMAKIFVNLPYDFNQTDKDMYIYCYSQAMGAGPLLTEMLQQFVRHPNDAIELQVELDRWNPVIQKLSDPQFEQFNRLEATELLGYIYHCLRDQPGFTVQRRSITNLFRESEAYHTRIRERAQQREVARRRRERLAEAERKRKDGVWNKHSSIQPLKEDSFKIVELTNKHMLNNEGLVMNHCVGSYSNKCMAGNCSIWSLREYKKNVWFSLITIELNKGKRIVQASGRFNATPKSEHMAIVRRWAKSNDVDMGVWKR